MKAIRIDYVRAGKGPGVLIEGVEYHAIINSSRHRSFTMPLSQEGFLDRLSLLCYHGEVPDQERQQALIELSEIVTKVLDLQEDDGAIPPVQIELVTKARELWALPFEAALSDKEPAFANPERQVVFTRRVPEPFAAHQVPWPVRPRVLFAYASAGGVVPFGDHKNALLQALQPWVEPYPGIPQTVGNESSVLTTLRDATLTDIENALRTAERDGCPYTHLHLLAHGAEINDNIRAHKKRWGVALGAQDGAPVSPEELVRVLRPQGGAVWEYPVAVTLAICYGGNAINPIIEAGSIAQELHVAGVPIVVASQLPLTFPGSEILTRLFYSGWMEGNDVREVLYDVRLALRKAENAGHDWVSMVSYVRLQEGYGDYVVEVALQGELAALETASNHAKHLIENGSRSSAEFDPVTDRLRARVQALQRSLGKLESENTRLRREVIQENSGLLGSANKRLAELLFERAQAETSGDEKAKWQHESHEALERARDGYRAGFRRNTADHWNGTQYLALNAILTGDVPQAEWYACKIAAMACSDESVSAKTRIWAFGSLAELELIAPCAGLKADPIFAADSLRKLCQLQKDSPGQFSRPTPTESTIRQLRRYITWWTKGNGFFPRCEADVSELCKRLIPMLEA